VSWGGEKMNDTNTINLTDDTLQNIYIMAPLLNEIDQNKVLGLMLGLIKGNKENMQDNNRKAG